MKCSKPELTDRLFRAVHGTHNISFSNLVNAAYGTFEQQNVGRILVQRLANHYKLEVKDDGKRS